MFSSRVNYSLTPNLRIYNKILDICKFLCIFALSYINSTYIYRHNKSSNFKHLSMENKPTAPEKGAKTQEVSREVTVTTPAPVTNEAIIASIKQFDFSFDDDTAKLLRLITDGIAKANQEVITTFRDALLPKLMAPAKTEEFIAALRLELMRTKKELVELKAKPATKSVNADKENEKTE